MMVKYGMALSFKNLFKASDVALAESAAPPSPALPEEKNEAKALFELKENLLHQAARDAHAQNRQPTLEDYRLAAEAFAKTPDGQDLADQGKWSPKIAADLSGQNIKGFEIKEKSLTSSKPTERKTTNMWDQDGDHTINDFYTNIDFTGAKLKDCIVDPATSFNDEIAKAKSLENIKFNHMEAGDTFTFGQGHYENITLTNINGGEIDFKGSKIHGLNMEGAKATSITMDSHTSISNLHAEGAHIVTLKGAPGATLSHAHFEGATIDMASDMKGMTLNHVDFKNANLGHVDMHGAKLKNVNFEGIDEAGLKGLDLSGAELHNVKINGKAIKSPAELKSFGVIIDGDTKADTSREFAMKAQVDEIKKNAQTWGQAKENEATVSPAMAMQAKPAEPQASAAVSMSYYREMSLKGGRA